MARNTMWPKLRRYRIIIRVNTIVAFGLSLVMMNALAFASDPLMDRDGRTLEVKIDGTVTRRIDSQPVADSEGAEAYTAFWRSESEASPRCFQINPRDERLGKLQRVTILVFEIRKDRPSHRWKSYQLVPDTIENTQQFSTDKGFCASEYILTERLRYPTLPSGEYLFRVAYWGEGNWDRQDILLKVK